MNVSVDEIIAVIEKIKKNIQAHRKELTKSEALVRYSLIDPFLNALGWDTTVPDLVKPEFSTAVGRPDYALFNLGIKPIAFIGAKPLDKVEDLSQYIAYCVEEGVRYFIASDGSKWEVYNTFKETRTPDKKIVEWNIESDEPYEIIMNALSISMPLNFPARKIDSIFNNITKPMQEENQEEDTGKSNVSSSTFREGSKRSSPNRPLRLEIDKQAYEAKYVHDVLIKTGEWLLTKKKLRTSDCPIKSGTNRYIANTEPRHGSGKKFVNPHRLENGVWLELHNSAERTEKLAKELLKHFNLSENLLKVKWSRS